MPMAAQGGWKPVPTTQPREAGATDSVNPDGGERIKPSAPGTIATNSNSVR